MATNPSLEWTKKERKRKLKKKKKKEGRAVQKGKERKRAKVIWNDIKLTYRRPATSRPRWI